MKTTATALLTSAILAVSALSLPAYAGSQDNGQNGQHASDQQHKNAGGNFDGKITAVRTIKFNNGKKYVLARIKDTQGNTAVLDLGTVKNLKEQNANVEKGQQIQASGRSGRLNDKPILVVYSFNTQGNGQNGSNDSSQYNSDNSSSQ